MAKGKRKLDKNAPYGQVYGSGRAAYEQFGILFDVEGKELPGQEEIESIEVQAPVVVDDAKVPVLVAEIEKLGKQNAELKEQLERAVADKDNADAEKAEVQGQLDTAEVEIKRLNGLIDELDVKADETAQTDKKTTSRGKKNVGVASSTDEQLDLQQGGKA